MSKYTKVPQTATLEQKLSSYTQKGDCWEYNGCTNDCGYCQIMVNKKLQYAHRLAWEFHNDKKIPSGMTIDHICFNRKCINPAHLRLMSMDDNRVRHNVSLKSVCEKHNCKRKIIWCWSSRSNKMMRRSVCLKCQCERTKKYKDKMRTVTQTARDSSAKAA